MVVHLADVSRVLGLFAQGLAGDYRHLKPILAADAAAEEAEWERRIAGGPGPGRSLVRGRDGVARAVLAGGDATSIHLPATIADHADARHNLGAYRVAILHQLGYAEFGTGDFDFDEACRRWPALAGRPRPPWPAASDLDRFFAAWRAPALMRHVFVLLEDLRIDRAIRGAYPGAREDLDRALAFARRARPALGPLAPFAALLEALLQHSLAADAAALAAAAPQAPIRRLLALAVPAAEPDATVFDAAAAAIDCYRLLERVALAQALDDPLLAPEWQAAGASAPAAGDDDASDPAAEGEAGEAADEKADGEADGKADGGAAGATVEQAVDEAVEDALEDAVDNAAAAAGADAAGAGAATPGRGGPARRDRPGAAATDVEAAFRAATALAGTRVAFRGRLQTTAVKARADAQAGSARSGATGGAAGTSADGLQSFVYDEWHYREARYLKGWCRLYERRLEGSDGHYVRDVHRRHPLLAREVRRRFDLIRPLSARRVRRVSDGEELEIDGVIEAVVDRRTGHATDEHVYRRRERGLREVAAAFLIDMSASTDLPVPVDAASGTAAGAVGGVDAGPGAAPDTAAGPSQDRDSPYLYGGRFALLDPPPDEPDDHGPPVPKRRIIDVAKESLALMSGALAALGDGFAIYGFSGDGREQVDFYVAKDFGDRLSSRSSAALAAIEPKRSTRMGPAIRHAVAKLARQPARQKVLIVVSDGYPQDRDYGPDRTDEEYGIQDTAMALVEAGRQRVQTFCVTIDPAGYDYLRRMCPDERYLVIDDVTDLPAQLTKVYRRLTG